MAIDPNATLQRIPGPVETTVGQEVVLMSLSAGECFGLGDTGSAVWRLLARPASLNGIVTHLGAEYDAPAEVIRTDVAELLEKMLALQLIGVAD